MKHTYKCFKCSSEYEYEESMTTLVCDCCGCNISFIGVESYIQLNNKNKTLEETIKELEEKISKKEYIHDKEVEFILPKESRLKGRLKKSKEGDKSKEVYIPLPDLYEIEKLKTENRKFKEELEKLKKEKTNLEAEMKNLIEAQEEETLKLAKVTLEDKIKPLERRKNIYKYLMIISSILCLIFIFI